MLCISSSFIDVSFATILKLLKLKLKLKCFCTVTVCCESNYGFFLWDKKMFSRKPKGRNHGANTPCHFLWNLIETIHSRRARWGSHLRKRQGRPKWLCVSNRSSPARRACQAPWAVKKVNLDTSLKRIDFELTCTAKCCQTPALPALRPARARRA